MTETTDLGTSMLLELSSRLARITPEEFTPPQMRPPRRRKLLGEATDYQKALVTLRDRILREHEELHLSRNLAFGGHIGLPPEHELMHAGSQILDALLVVNLSNTFRELSADVSYYISPNWKVYVGLPPMGPPPRKTKYNPFR